MANTFNDGQSFGEIRQILNGNANELNETKATANQAKIDAENAASRAVEADINATEALTKAKAALTAGTTLADSGVQGEDYAIGVIKPLKLSPSYEENRIPNAMEKGFALMEKGFLKTLPVVVAVGSGDLLSQITSIITRGVGVFILNGMYTKGWKGNANANYNATLLVCSALNRSVLVTHTVAFDMETGEVWTLFAKDLVIEGKGWKCATSPESISAEHDTDSFTDAAASQPMAAESEAETGKEAGDAE